MKLGTVYETDEDQVVLQKDGSVLWRWNLYEGEEEGETIIPAGTDFTEYFIRQGREDIALCFDEDYIGGEIIVCKEIVNLLCRIRKAAVTPYPEPEPQFDPTNILSGPHAEWETRRKEWADKVALQELIAYRAVADFAAHMAEDTAVGQGIYAETAVADLEDMVSTWAR